MEDEIQESKNLGCQKDYLHEILKFPKMTCQRERKLEAKSQETNRIGLKI